MSEGSLGGWSLRRLRRGILGVFVGRKKNKLLIAG
jgi:hypothetical protein